MTLAFDATAFRTQLPNLFADPPFTDGLLEVFWDTAICYISPESNNFLDDTCLRQAINLMTAHLATQNQQAQGSAPGGGGGQTGFVENATIDKVSVTVQTFDNPSKFQYWLNQTPFGMQLYALLHAAAAGGFYVGGFNELGSFRRARGIFTPSLGS